MQRVVTGAIIEEKRILLVNKKGTWIIPGGKPEEGESDLACLSREIREELSGTKINPKSVEYLAKHTSISPHIKITIEVLLYRLESDGEIGRASAEISDSRWMFYETAIKENLSDSTEYFVNLLRQRDII